MPDMPQPMLPFPMPWDTEHFHFNEVFEAQAVHLFQPSWRPTTGDYGLPLTQHAWKEHVYRLRYAFTDCSLVFDGKRNVDRFHSDGQWVQDPKDIEAVCWELVQHLVSLHVDGAYGLFWRRLPDPRPAPNHTDSMLSFRQRIFLLEIGITFYKGFAHSLMLRESSETLLVNMNSFLFLTLNFKEHVLSVPAERRRYLVQTYNNRAMPAGMLRALLNVVPNTTYHQRDQQRRPGPHHAPPPPSERSRNVPGGEVRVPLSNRHRNPSWYLL